MRKSENNMMFLEEGDKFQIEYFKTMPSKKYPDRMMGKILTKKAEEVFTSSAKIVKIIDELMKDTEVNLSEITFEVINAGKFNDKPVLSLRADNERVQLKIIKILF